LTKSHGPRIEFSASGTTQLDATTTDEVLRVLQEALSNALRHARAEHIRVRLERDARTLLLTVEDDGVGLDSDPDHAGGGVGLASMRDRAERLNGELVVRPGAAEERSWSWRSPSRPHPRPSRVALPPTTQRVLPRGRRRASPGGDAPTHGEPEGVEGPASRQTPARPTSGT
jgi:hypothetical protein